MNVHSSQRHYENGLDAKAAADYPRAIREFQNAIERDPNHALAHQEFGWLTYGSGGDLSEARRHLESAIRLCSQLGDAHLYLAIVLNRLSEPDASERHFEIALELSDDSALVHATFAEEFLWHNSRYGEAEEHFLAALKADPEMALALRDYARMLSCHGRDAEAEPLFNRALELDPDDRHTKRAFDEFVAETMAADRDPLDCLQAAIEKDPTYIRGIAALKNTTASRIATEHLYVLRSQVVRTFRAVKTVAFILGPCFR